MDNTEYLIVGAGISGLTSALTLLHKCPGAHVTIIDSASDAGGLLRSVSYNGLNYDFGTHIPEIPGNAELEAILFPKEFCANWQWLPRLKTGNYFASEMNNQSQFLDVTKATSWFYTALYQLLQTQDDGQTSYADLDTFCRARYGACIADRLFTPLMKKFTGKSLNCLSDKAPAYYGLSRLIFGDRNCAVNLKKIPAFDKVLAYSSDSEKPRNAQWIYPPSGAGIGSWIQMLTENIVKLGGKFKFNCKISAIKPENGLMSVQTNSGELQAKKVIWTVPAYIGLQGVQQHRPESKTVAIYHFYSDTKPASQQHYIYCYDATMQSYRITLYDNIQQSNNPPYYRCSVEVIKADDKTVVPSAIGKELVKMGLFTDIDQIIHAGTIELPFGFPIPQAGDEQRRKDIFEQVKLHNSDIVFCGRGKPDVFFMTDVLLDTYNEAVNLLPTLELT
jgi:protoporphyrinogen oxidase